jgi:hypothetical protein
MFPQGGTAGASSNVESTTSIADDIRLLSGEDESEEGQQKDDKKSQSRQVNRSAPEKKEDEEEEETKEEGSEEEEGDEGEEEKKDEEEEEEQPEVEVTTERPTIKEIKSKYPQLFKSFPALRGVIFREQQFSDLFPTPEAAKTAVEYSEQFEQIRESVIGGDSKDFVKAIKAEKGGLEAFSRSILPALFEVDKDAHWAALEPTLQTVVRKFYASSKDDNVRNAALFLSEFLFGDDKIATGEKSVVDEVKLAAEKARKEEREKYSKEQWNSFSADVSTTAYSRLEAVVLQSLAKESDLSTFVKNSAKASILQEVQAALHADKAHLSRMDNLWKRAEKARSAEDKNSIINAYLSRAKQLVVTAKNKILTEIRGDGAPPRTNKQQSEKRREPSAAGRNSGGKPTQIDAKNVDWTKTSDADFLNGKVTYKGR